MTKILVGRVGVLAVLALFVMSMLSAAPVMAANGVDISVYDTTGGVQTEITTGHSPFSPMTLHASHTYTVVVNRQTPGATVGELYLNYNDSSVYLNSVSWSETADSKSCSHPDTQSDTCTGTNIYQILANFTASGGETGSGAIRARLGGSSESDNRWWTLVNP